MYFPYLRGKQFELILLRENASLIKKAGFVPIIEPVKNNGFGSLIKTAMALVSEQVEFICVINPIYGDFADGSALFQGELQEFAKTHHAFFVVGVIVTPTTDLAKLKELINQVAKFKLALIHYGFPKPKLLKLSLKSQKIEHHIFISETTSSPYWGEFADHPSRVLIQDGFRKRAANREYPPREPFTNLYKLYKQQGMSGFGDFTIMSDEFSETGGPAYAVAIHLTDLEQEKISAEDLKIIGITAEEVEPDEIMLVRHYVSDSNETFSNPGAKFAEALDKLVDDLNDNVYNFVSTACNEFSELHKSKHYPGLGYTKKLSMQHHLELMNSILNPEI